MNRLLKQLIGFVGISGIGWVLDVCVYTLLGLFSTNLAMNNTISSWLGVSFVFLFSTRKIFRNQSRIALKWKYLIYLAYQGVLIFCASRVLSFLNSWLVAAFPYPLVTHFSALAAKILVTPFTMVINFLAMKGIIEKI